MRYRNFSIQVILNIVKLNLQNSNISQYIVKYFIYSNLDAHIVTQVQV